MTCAWCSGREHKERADYPAKEVLLFYAKKGKRGK